MAKDFTRRNSGKAEKKKFYAEARGARRMQRLGREKGTGIFNVKDVPTSSQPADLTLLNPCRALRASA